MDYADLDIRIGARAGAGHPIHVLRSPAGEFTGTLRLPVDSATLRHRFAAARRLGGNPARDLEPVLAVADGPVESIESLGRILFDALFPRDGDGDSLRTCYRLSREHVARQDGTGAGLRIRLRFSDLALAVLPWEYLFDEGAGDFVCLSAETPLVRYLELPSPPAPLRVDPPLRVLGMVAAPSDLAWLDVAEEQRRMGEALAPLVGRGLVELTWMEGSSWRELQSAMRAGPWHVFHFIGHGGFDGGRATGMLLFEGEGGRAQALNATEVGRLLADHATLRLAVLNACNGAQASEHDAFSSIASTLIRRGLPSVIAMQYEISDPAALEFSREFYRALTDGQTVDGAVSEARKAISLALKGTLEWATPTLHMRSPDGMLFRLTPERPPSLERSSAGMAAIDTSDDFADVPSLGRGGLKWALGGVGALLLAWVVFLIVSGL